MHVILKYICVLAFFICCSLLGWAGDTPCTASSLSLNCGPKQFGNNIGLTDSGIGNPSCGNFQGGDAWYTVTVPSTGVVEINLVSIATQPSDLGMAVYTANNCSGPFNSIICSDASMPYFIADNLSAGSTLYIRIWENGNDDFGSYEIEVIDPNDVFCLNDDAVTFNFPADTCMQTTNDAQNEKGCAWYRNTIDFSEDIDEWMILFLGDSNGGADGMTVVFHNDPLGTNACGSIGEGMGAAGIQNALIIEVDTYNNGSVLEGGGDFNYDHIAVWVSDDGPSNPLVIPVRAKFNGNNIEDNFTHLLRVEWTASTQIMNIYFDGDLRATLNHDFVTNVFGSKNVFWGSTGATGFYSNQQYLCPFIPNFTILPVDLYRFEVACHGEHQALNWTTLSEVNNDYFSIERSSGGIEFSEVARVTGAGNSSETLAYSWTDNEKGDFYYRLKQVDFDGSFEYSQIEYASCTTEDISLFPNPAENDLFIRGIEDPSSWNLEIYNSFGQVVHSQSNLYSTKLDVAFLRKGSYFIKLWDRSKTQVLRFVKT
ncbi:MAG: T9SS type A sorting domain-containing protein [Bacteroidota bacterium]